MSGWQKLGELWYRKQDLCVMKWREDPYRLMDDPVAAAPYSGAIAVVTSDATLNIYTAAGSLLCSSSFNFPGLVEMAWVHGEVLVCLFKDGVMRTFSAFGEKLHFFTMSEKLRAEGGVVQAAVGDRGAVVVTSNLNVYANLSFSKPMLRKLCFLTSPPLALCVLPASSPCLPSQLNHPAAVSPDDGLQVLLSKLDGPLLLLTSSHGWFDLSPICGSGPYMSMCVSRTSSLLCLLTTTGAFKVYSLKSLQHPLDSGTTDCRYGEGTGPRQVVWCGDDCLVIYVVRSTPSGELQHILLVGGPERDWLAYQYGYGLIVVSEVDGVRVISPYKTEVVQRVTRATDAIFSLGSCEAPAMLCYALERYEEGDVAADESLRTIEGELGDAVHSCIEAAAYEIKTELIVGLLRAAAFGRHFLMGGEGIRTKYSGIAGNARRRDVSCLEFVESCGRHRICTAARSEPLEMIGLNVVQLRHLGEVELVRLMAGRRCHQLAYSICDYVGLSPAEVLVHWAGLKIHCCLSMTDEELCKVVVKKFQRCPGVSYSEVAYVAARAGRANLATRLLEYEPRSTRQVQILLQLGEVSLATEKAVASGDPELVYECIGSILSRELSTADGQLDLSLLVGVLKEKPLATDLFGVFCKETGEWELLEQYYERRGMLVNAGWVAVALALSKEEGEQRNTWLAFAAGFFGSDGETFAQRRCLEEIELLAVQRELEVKAVANGWEKRRFVGLAIIETIRTVIMQGEFVEGDRLQRHFAVPDKRYWRCKINALADGGYFGELLSFAQNRTSAVGYEPFLEAAVRCQARDVAGKLISRFVKDSGEQAKWYESAGLTGMTAAGPQQEGRILSGITGAIGESRGIFETITGAFSRRG
eukprot:GHVQ01001339.1.p1 GENE.GHVQ01001339.1~~GHVQ01001339.1.p1  ORF type:complete len:870 (+),score=113.88 GHVQ01001339.1:273-2882(+)